METWVVGSWNVGTRRWKVGPGSWQVGTGKEAEE